MNRLLGGSTDPSPVFLLTRLDYRLVFEFVLVGVAVLWILGFLGLLEGVQWGRGGPGSFWEGLEGVLRGSRKAPGGLPGGFPLAGPWTVPGSLPQQSPNKAPTRPQQGPHETPTRPPRDPTSRHIKAPTRPPRDPASRHIAPHHITSPLFGPLGSPKGPPGPPEMDPRDPQKVTTSTRILHFFTCEAMSKQGSTMGWLKAG